MPGLLHSAIHLPYCLRQYSGWIVEWTKEAVEAIAVHQGVTPDYQGWMRR
jgi:hypothetical protein